MEANEVALIIRDERLGFRDGIFAPSRDKRGRDRIASLRASREFPRACRESAYRHWGRPRESTNSTISVAIKVLSFHHAHPSKWSPPQREGRRAERIGALVGASFKRIHGVPVLVIAHSPQCNYCQQRDSRSPAPGGLFRRCTPISRSIKEKRTGSTSPATSRSRIIGIRDEDDVPRIPLL